MRISVSGINEQEYREFLGLQIGNSGASRAGAKSLHAKLKGCRLGRLRTAKRAVRAIEQQLQAVTRQRWQTHFLRNILDVTPNRHVWIVARCL
ncbi:transposase [Aeribacillus composti]|uniref:transposase n=1 Tax=Aeribacillus TaxID=1055323 RepID=UPI0035C8A2E1